MSSDENVPEWFWHGKDYCPQCERRTAFAFTCIGTKDVFCDYCKEPHPASMLSWECLTCGYAVGQEEVEARFEQVVSGLEVEEISVCLREQDERRARPV